MNNKLIINLIKNNIEEIRTLIIHFQNEENDLKTGFPLLESRLDSLNKDIEILKSSLNKNDDSSAEVLNPIGKQSQTTPSIENEDTQVQLEEQICNDKPIREETVEHFKKETCDKEEHIISTLNDKLHESRGNNLQEKIKKSKLKDIQSAIGINDQFLFIRELFDNKSEEYKSVINYINSEDDYSIIISYLKKNYEWDNEDVTVIQFFELIKRKFE